jgi:hypothetical protein
LKPIARLAEGLKLQRHAVANAQTMIKKRGPSKQAEPKETLAELIERAFADVPYPGDDGIAHNQHYGDGEEVAAAFKGQHWRTVPVEVLGRQAESGSFFTPEACRFFLPAYMLAEIRKGPPERASRWLMGRIMYALDGMLYPPRGGGVPSDEFRQRMDPLTPQQKEAVRRFLYWLNRKWTGSAAPSSRTENGQLSEVDRALRDYWEHAR